VDHVAENIPEVETYYPVFEKLVRPHGLRKPMAVTRPVYPGYVFAKIEMNGKSVHMLVSAPVKARFIRFGGTISTVPDDVIRELRRLELSKLLVREIHRVNPYIPGKKVRIHTPVADIQAVIIALLNKTRAVVDTPVGRVTVQIHQITILSDSTS
jgi:transcription antitermination factor NusG